MRLLTLLESISRLGMLHHYRLRVFLAKDSMRLGRQLLGTLRRRVEIAHNSLLDRRVLVESAQLRVHDDQGV